MMQIRRRDLSAADIKVELPLSLGDYHETLTTFAES